MKIKETKADEGKIIDWGATRKLTIELIEDIQNDNKPVFLVQSFSSKEGELSLDSVIMTQDIVINGMKLTPPDKTVKSVNLNF